MIFGLTFFGLKKGHENPINFAATSNKNDIESNFIAPVEEINETAMMQYNFPAETTGAFAINNVKAKQHSAREEAMESIGSNNVSIKRAIECKIDTTKKNILSDQTIEKIETEAHTFLGKDKEIQKCAAKYVFSTRPAKYWIKMK